MKISLDFLSTIKVTVHQESRGDDLSRSSIHLHKSVKGVGILEGT